MSGRGDRGRAPRRRMLGRRWLLFAAPLLVAVAIAGVILTRAGNRIELPAPRAVPGAAAAGASFEDFAGSEACAGCHRAEYEAWRGSTHGGAGGAPAQHAIAPFDGQPIRFADAVVVPGIDSDGGYFFRLAEEGRPERLFRVAGVVGGGHMAGGGTQGFFSEFPDGTLRFLPFDFHAGARLWFCQTGGRRDEGWRPIAPDLKLSDCSDWPPARVLGSRERFPNCQGCHGSQIELSFRPDEKRYRTRYTTLAVNCEACHGPGRRHVELAHSGALNDSTDIGMAPLAVLSEDESLRVCFGCHAVKEELRPGHLAGEAVEEYFSLGLPLLSYRPFFPDGRIRLFAYQGTHRFSDCYLSGRMTCVDCHDPHDQGYRDVQGRRLSGRFDDGQCTGCHPSKAERPEQHTHHPAASPGGRCVACHMPYLQEPDVGERLRYARADHTIPIPRPALDAIFGIRNACQSCHEGWSQREVGERIGEWYGELKPLDANLEGLLLSRRVKDPRRAAELMIGPRNDHTAPRIQGLAYYFLAYLSPDMPPLDPWVATRLKELARDADPDLAAIALAALHFAQGEDRDVRGFLADRLESLGAGGDAVRRRWARALEWRGGAYLERGETARARATLMKALEVRPGDPSLLRRLADVRLRTGDHEGAIAAYRESLRAGWPSTRVSLGFALARTGRWDEALESYRRAIEENPWEAQAFVGLGKLYMSRRAPAEAIAAFERAIGIDPGLAEAYFSLGSLYSQVGEREKAMEALSRGLELRRDASEARELLERLQK